MAREAKLYVGANESPVYDYTDWIDWESFELGARAYNGESAQGQAVLRDERGEIGDSDGLPGTLTARVMRGHNLFRLTEDASGSTRHLVRARVADKDWTRGRQKADRAREVSPTFGDHNTDLRGIIVGKSDPWSRGAETDVARVNAVLAAFCNGSPRATTVIANTRVAAGNTTTMPATDYEDRTPLDVIGECAAAAGKIFFVYLEDNGSLSLWYDIPASTTLTSTLSISDRIDEVDGWTVFEPEWVVGPASRESGQNILSGLSVRYAEGRAVSVTDATVADDYDYWEEMVYDSASETEAQATALATSTLNIRKREELTYACRLLVPAERVHLIKAGMLISVHARAIPDADDVTKSSRIGQCKYTPLNNDWYHVLLELERPKRARPIGKGDQMAIAIRKATPAPYSCRNPNHPTDDFRRQAVAGGWGTSTSGLEWTLVTPAGTAYTDGNVGYLVPPADINLSEATVTVDLTGCDALSYPVRASFTVSSNKEAADIYVGPPVDSGRASVFLIRMETTSHDLIGSCHIINKAGGTDPGPWTECTVGYDGTFTVQAFPGDFDVVADEPFTVDVYWGEDECRLAVNGVTQITSAGVPAAHPAPTLMRFRTTNDRAVPGNALNPTLRVLSMDVPELGNCSAYASGTEECPPPRAGQMALMTYVATGDGTSTTFTIPFGDAYEPGSLTVEVDGLYQEVIETDPATGEFELTFAPTSEERIFAEWRVA